MKYKMSIEDLLGQIEDILEEGKRSLVGDKVRIASQQLKSATTKQS